MEIIRIPRIMRETSRRLLVKGRTVGFVPTMGSLHQGHMFLFKTAREENDIVVASIFVNPIQFGPGEDFDNYPRDLETDVKKLEAAGVDILFAPEAPSMYPEGFSTSVSVKGLSDRLCGAFRPGHFDGVATVVCKLFSLVLPTRSYFGQKDYQQSQIIRRMIRDLDLGIECIVCSTVRESDGLAMSSRNRYLSQTERHAAAVIFQSLQAAAAMIRKGAGPSDVSAHVRTQIESEPLVTEVQYAGVYDPDTLEARTVAARASLVAAAVKIGNTRLIDNIIVELKDK
ncbi:MAG TPA: pantoate--beta-alanine ligase [Dissulfurispiraceae bacterium]|nr:pantoate--beta-alanine ligase [Dissulfurispiraceae bacterium]